MRSDKPSPRRLALPVAVLLALSAMLVNPATIAAASAAPEQRAALSLADMALAIVAPGARLLDRANGVQAVSPGSDGRLTFLLLGSDSRAAGISRTDTIMIASLKGKAISLASIPRDTGRIPNPSGGFFPGKVNGLIRSFILGGMSRDAALARFESIIEYTMGIQIDYYAVVWFGGLTTLVDKVDPIYVANPKEVRDPKQVDDPNSEWGVYFPQSASTNYALWAYNPTGRPLCNGLYKFDTGTVEAKYHCHRALPFVRSRKGPKNNDWVRARRQQHFIFRTIKAITSVSEVNSLYGTASGQGMGKWITNMPLSLANAQDLYSKLSGSSLSAQVVFKPNKWASKVAGTSQYQLKLPLVRQWAKANMK